MRACIYTDKGGTYCDLYVAMGRILSTAEQGLTQWQMAKIFRDRNRFSNKLHKEYMGLAEP